MFKILTPASDERSETVEKSKSQMRNKATIYPYGPASETANTCAVNTRKILLSPHFSTRSIRKKYVDIDTVLVHQKKGIEVTERGTFIKDSGSGNVV